MIEHNTNAYITCGFWFKVALDYGGYDLGIVLYRGYTHDPGEGW